MSRVDQKLRYSYFRYAKSVIEERALPDFRDGLKPVQRRILFSMWIHGNRRTDRYRKSANVVGHVIGELHPHGDSPVYQALVRMAQDFSMGIELIDKQGNFGSIDGDEAAAMRYTESRLSYYAHEFFLDFNDKTTPMEQNYDGSILEATILPTRSPNLLVNGSYGIAVGVATSIPPHNLGEVVDALISMLDLEEEEVILSHIKGPDLPTGGVILGLENIKEIYRKGEGSVNVRGKYFIENNQIIFYEIPYQVQKSELIKRLAYAINDGRISEVSSLRDESDRDGIRIVLKLKNNANSDIAVNQIFNNTQLQSSLRICLFALDQDKNPKIFTILEFLEGFLSFRIDVVTKRIKNELEKEKNRISILIGLLLAQDNIDIILNKVKTLASKEDMSNWLRENSWDCSKFMSYLDSLGVILKNNKYNLTKEQVGYILELKIQNLVKMERGKLESELSNLKQSVDKKNEILKSPEKLKGIVREELLELKRKFATSRKTEITYNLLKCQEIDLVTKEDVLIILNKSGYIKRVNMDNYEAQKRGGKGKTGYHEFGAISIANTHDKILFFTTSGFVYSLYCYQIPPSLHNSKGRAVVNLLNLDQDEKILRILVVNKETENFDIVFVGEKGHVRKNKLIQFAQIRSNGKKYIDEEESDKICQILLAPPGNELFIATALGMAVRCDLSDFRSFNSRNSSGVRGCRLSEGDRVVGAVTARKDQSILTITEKGFAKKTRCDSYRKIKRGGRGVRNLKISNKNGKAVDIVIVEEDEDILLMTEKGRTIRFSSQDIRNTSRNTMGVTALNIGDDRVISMEKYIISEENE